MKNIKIIMIITLTVMLLSLVTAVTYNTYTGLQDAEQQLNSNVLSQVNCSDLSISYIPDDSEEDPIWYNRLDGTSYFKYTFTFPHAKQILGDEVIKMRYSEKTVQLPNKQSKWIDVRNEVTITMKQDIELLCEGAKLNLARRFDYQTN